MPNQYIPKFSYNDVVGLQSKLPSIKSKQLMVAIAINDFSKKVAKLSADELQKLDLVLVKLCYSWEEEKKIPKNARGFKGSKRNM